MDELWMKTVFSHFPIIFSFMSKREIITLATGFLEVLSVLSGLKILHFIKN